MNETGKELQLNIPDKTIEEDKLIEKVYFN
jgi:hypothetical protein